MGSKSYSNGILTHGFCNVCVNMARQDTTCYKCRKNQRSGKLGTKDWNFCFECLQEQAINRKYCLNCQKIIVWESWEDEQWKDESKDYHGRPYDLKGTCSHYCSQEMARKNYNKRQADDFLKEPLPPAKPSDLCEGCGMDCRTDIKVADKGSKFVKTWHSIRVQITTYWTDFTIKKKYFGTACSCAENFKREHQNTCQQCHKTEWPDIKKGWLWDYELHKPFCSFICHFKYRKAQWEKENGAKSISTPKPTSWAKKARLFPADLELSDGGKGDFDWEKEGLKKEVLTLRESVKELERKMKAKSTGKKIKSGEELEMENYLLELHQNTQEQAEQAYENKYGKSELDLLSANEVQQPKKNHLPLIIGGVLIGGGIIVGLIFLAKFLAKNKKHG
jgi:hypothetical protein